MVLPTTVGNSPRSAEHCSSSCTSRASRSVPRTTRFPSTSCSNSGLKQASTACLVITTEPGSRPEDRSGVTAAGGGGRDRARAGDRPVGTPHAEALATFHFFLNTCFY